MFVSLQCQVINKYLHYSIVEEWMAYVIYGNVTWTSWRLKSSVGWLFHDDVIKWRNFPHYWPIVQGIHQSPVNYPQKGHWGGALMFSLICAWINAWVNNCEAGDLRLHRTHYDVIAMCWAVYSGYQQIKKRCLTLPILCAGTGWYPPQSVSNA